MAVETHTPRAVLLVDDEQNIINALSRTLRRDGYRIFKATSAEEGLKLLAENQVGVIISDQRMPQMTGVDFLRKVKLLYPKTIRIVLSGYTELESVTSAINEGAIYKFLTKPWEDDLLLENVREAFEHHEMEMENQRLTRELQHSNHELSRLSQNLELEVQQKTREIMHNITMLEISQEILEHLPVAIIGIDNHNMIAASNRRADQLFAGESCLLGFQASEVLPDSLLQLLKKADMVNSQKVNEEVLYFEDGAAMHVWVSPMGDSSRSKGLIAVISPLKER